MFKSSNFVEEVENLCKTKNIEYIDAVVLLCEMKNIEVETAAYWIRRDSTLKAKIQVEAEDLNILKRRSRLPV